MELVAKDTNWKARTWVSSPTPVNEATAGSFLLGFLLTMSNDRSRSFFERSCQGKPRPIAAL